MLRIYFDTCCLMRPFDNRGQQRTALESDAIVAVLETCFTGKLDLISSEILLYEIHESSLPERRLFARLVLEKASATVKLDTDVERRADEFEASGIDSLDALHLASAEAAAVDFFCTCDDRLLRKAARIKILRTAVVSPLKLLETLP